VNLVPRIKPVRSTRLGDGLATGIELVGPIVVAFLIGWGLDTWLGTTPVLMIVLTVLGVAGQGTVSYYRYEATMKEHEAAFRAGRQKTAPK
jgi:ATP synthase protein I